MLSVLPALLWLGPQDPANDLLRFFYSKATDRTIGTRIEADYRTTPVRFLDLAERVTRRVIEPDFDYRSGVPVATRAKNIQAAVLNAVNQTEPSSNDLLKERMVIQGLYDWTRTHLVYNLWLANRSNDRKILKNHWYAKDLFMSEQPNAVCAGFADVFTSMANSVGIETLRINGVTRTSFEQSKLPATMKGGDHSWAICREKDGFVLPADPTNSAVSLLKARQLQGRIQ